MNYMFFSCKQNMKYMFAFSSLLMKLNLSNYNINHINDMTIIFDGC